MAAFSSPVMNPASAAAPLTQPAGSVEIPQSKAANSVANAAAPFFETAAARAASEEGLEPEKTSLWAQRSSADE